MINFANISTFRKLNFIFRNITVLISILGTFGNILVIIIFFRRSLRKYSYSLYSQVKALGDIFILVYQFRIWSNITWDANLDIVNVFFCKADEYLLYLFCVACLWLLALISMDRLLIVAYPNRFKIYNKKWFQVILILIAFAYSAGVNILMILNSNYSVSSRTGLGNCMVSLDILTTQSWIYAGNIFGIVLMLNNALIIRLIVFIASSRKKVTTISSTNNTQTSSTTVPKRNSSHKDRKLAVSAIGLSLTAFVCKLPFSVFLIISINAKVSSEITSMTQSICIAFMTLENAASFFINMLLNSMFKDEFLIMIGKKRRSDNSSVVHTTNSINVRTILNTNL